MNLLLFGLVALFLLATSGMPAQAQNKHPVHVVPNLGTQDPTDIYLNALKLTKQADELAKNSQTLISAIRLVQQAEDQFAYLADHYPTWRPQMLKKRRQINQENIHKWQLAAKNNAQNQVILPTNPERPVLPAPAVRPTDTPTPNKPLPKPNIPLPPGYQGVDFSHQSANNRQSPSAGLSVPPGELPGSHVESNYERVRKLLDKTTTENQALIKALKQTRKAQEEALAQLAVATTGQSVYRDELLKVKKQLESERKTNNKLLSSLSQRVEELEAKVQQLSQEREQHLTQIANLQQQVQEYQEALTRLGSEKAALQKDRDQLAILVELNSPEKTKNLLDHNLTLAAQLKDAQEKIAALESAHSDSEEQRKNNLRVLEQTRTEAIELKQQLMALHDENIGYRKRITELNTQLVNADAELAKLAKSPQESPILHEENELLRSTIAKQLRILAVQQQSRQLLIDVYKNLYSQDPQTQAIAAILDNEEAIKLTPAEQRIVNTIAAQHPNALQPTKQQQAKLVELEKLLLTEQKKAERLSKELDSERNRFSKQTQKIQADAQKQIANSQKALDTKNRQVERLTKQLQDLKAKTRQPLIAKQQEQINRLTQQVATERAKATELANNLAQERAKTNTQSQEQAQQHAAGIVAIQTSLEQKNQQIDRLTRQLEQMTEQLHNPAIPVKQQQQIDKLTQLVETERSKAQQLARQLANQRQQTDEQALRQQQVHEQALITSQQALASATAQVQHLTAQLEQLKKQTAEQLQKAQAKSTTEQKTIEQETALTVRKKLEVEALAQGAAEAFEKKRYAAAEQLYRTLIDIQPDDVPALVNLGTILLQRNKVTNALPILTQATRLAPDAIPAWLMLGIAQYRTGQDSEALASLQKTIQLDPGNTTALLYLGNIENAFGRYDKAALHFKNVLKILPSSAEAHFNLAWTNARLGNITEARKNYDAAIRHGGLPDPELQQLLTSPPPSATAAPANRP